MQYSNNLVYTFPKSAADSVSTYICLDLVLQITFSSAGLIAIDNISKSIPSDPHPLLLPAHIDISVI